MIDTKKPGCLKMGSPALLFIADRIYPDEMFFEFHWAGRIILLIVKMIVITKTPRGSRKNKFRLIFRVTSTDRYVMEPKK